MSRGIRIGAQIHCDNVKEVEIGISRYERAGDGYGWHRIAIGTGIGSDADLYFSTEQMQDLQMAISAHLQDCDVTKEEAKKEIESLWVDWHELTNSDRVSEIEAEIFRISEEHGISKEDQFSERERILGEMRGGE